jgi:diguanylate cyclase (GGDEF)-like protein
VQDISESVRRRDDLHHAAHFDILTGMRNRRGLLERLGYDGEHGSGGLVFFDIDGLKAINDAYGHLAGDTVIRSVGQRLQAAVRANDVVARLGGDEFVVFVNGVTNVDDLDRICHDLQSRVAEPLLIGRAVLQPSVSAGTAVFSGVESLDEALQHADHSMYASKRARRPERPGERRDPERRRSLAARRRSEKPSL